MMVRTPDDLGDHDSGPGGDDDSQGGEEPLEGDEEVIGTEDDGDGAHGHDGGVDGSGHVSAHGQAGRQERQARGVQVHDDAAGQPQDGDDREGDEEPRGQDRGQGADGVGVDGLAELGVGAHQEDAEEDEHHAGQCRSQRGPADDAGC